MGKTRLLQAARDDAAHREMQTLTARATELERDFPFALVRQLFEPALHALGREVREELLADAARPAGSLMGVDVGGDDEPAPGDLTADPSFATLNAIYWLTSNLSERAPLLLAVDDTHWSDKASLRFFRFLAPRLEDLPALLVLAARPAEPGADYELLDQLVADPAARTLRPQALSTMAVAELVRARLASDAADEFCTAAHAASGGNPFLLHELLVELAAQSSAGTATEARELRDLLPASIQQAILLRLARLSDEARSLARAVAVLGDGADPRQVADLADLDPKAVAVARDALAAVDVLEPGRPLRFAHPLVRNAIYGDLPSAERAGAHRAAAMLLEAEGAEAERIAVHLLATDPAEDQRVIELLARAAQRALGRSAPETAVAYLRRALLERPEGDRARRAAGAARQGRHGLDRPACARRARS